ncbi:MAG: hypothetical protein AABW50_05285 [Nanoarchaeota archaeon]
MDKDYDAQRRSMIEQAVKGDIIRFGDKEDYIYFIVREVRDGKVYGAMHRLSKASNNRFSIDELVNENACMPEGWKPKIFR